MSQEAFGGFLITLIKGGGRGKAYIWYKCLPNVNLNTTYPKKRLTWRTFCAILALLTVEESYLKDTGSLRKECVYKV